MSLILFALVFIFANNAGALHKASPVETTVIQDHLDDAKMAERLIDAARDEELGRADPHRRTTSLPHSSEELAKIMAEAKEFERQMRREDAERRRLASNQQHLASLRSLAERLCSNPESVTQADFDSLAYVTDTDFYWREQDRVVRSGEFFGTCCGRLGKGCALKVYKYFARVNKDAGKLDADAVNSQAGRGGYGGDEGGRPRGSPRREWSQPPNPKLTPPKFR